MLQSIYSCVSLVKHEARASKKEVHKSRYFKRYVSMSEFGHSGSMCHEKDMRKAHTFVLGPFQKYFCGTGAEFRYSKILALIYPDLNNSFLFSSPVSVCLLFNDTPISSDFCLPSQLPGPSTVSELVPLALGC